MNELILNNGYRIPQLGFGTIGQMGAQVSDNVAFALINGYLLIDTANRYGNEKEVGIGLKASGLKRGDYFVETKLGPTLYEKETAVDDTLARLGLNYIDVMLLHHPVNNYIKGYQLLERAYQEGKLKAIGLSNFPIEKIQEIIDNCDIMPSIMQVECHPYYPADKVKNFCDQNNIKLQSWYPLGHGNTEMLEDRVFKELAEAYHRSPIQIILRWHIQMGFGLVPGSQNPDHIKSNAEIFDFSLSNEDMNRISRLNRHQPFYQVTEESLHRMAVTKCSFE